MDYASLSSCATVLSAAGKLNNTFYFKANNNMSGILFANPHRLKTDALKYEHALSSLSNVLFSHYFSLYFIVWHF